MPAPALRPGGIGFEEQGENERERVGRTRGRKNFTLVFHQTGDRLPQVKTFSNLHSKRKINPHFVIFGQSFWDKMDSCQDVTTLFAGFTLIWPILVTDVQGRANVLVSVVWAS